MALLIFFLILALTISFWCSVMEAVLLSVTPEYIAELKQQQPRAGAKLEKLKAEIGSSLGAILSLNTIAHTFGAAGVGAQATLVFGEPHLGVISFVLTLLILFLSEIIPKTLGAVRWQRLAPRLVPWLELTVQLLWPFAKFSQVLTRLLIRER